MLYSFYLTNFIHQLFRSFGVYARERERLGFHQTTRLPADIPFICLYKNTYYNRHIEEEEKVEPFFLSMRAKVVRDRQDQPSLKGILRPCRLSLSRSSRNPLTSLPRCFLSMAYVYGTPVTHRRIWAWLFSSAHHPLILDTLR